VERFDSFLVVADRAPRAVVETDGQGHVTRLGFQSKSGRDLAGAGALAAGEAVTEAMPAAAEAVEVAPAAPVEAVLAGPVETEAAPVAAPGTESARAAPTAEVALAAEAEAVRDEQAAGAVDAIAAASPPASVAASAEDAGAARPADADTDEANPPNTEAGDRADGAADVDADRAAPEEKKEEDEPPRKKPKLDEETAVEDDVPLDKKGLMRLKKAELQERCRAKGLDDDGTKAVLVDRLLES